MDAATIGLLTAGCAAVGAIAGAVAAVISSITNARVSRVSVRVNAVDSKVDEVDKKVNGSHTLLTQALDRKTVEVGDLKIAAARAEGVASASQKAEG